MESASVYVDLFFLNDAGAVRLFPGADGEGPLSGSVRPKETVLQACIRGASERLGVILPEARVRVLTESGGRAICLCYHTLPPQENIRDVFPEEIDPAMMPGFSQLPPPEEGIWFPLLCLESVRWRVPPGHYRHFKGGEYQVRGIALNSENLEPTVIYQALYGSGEIWVRPARMWLQQVERDGYQGPRFLLIQTDAP